MKYRQSFLAISTGGRTFGVR